MDKKNIYWYRIAIIFAFGGVGVISALPIIPELIAATGHEPPLPIMVIQVLSTIQSSVILFAMVMLGAWLSPRINLGTPILDAYLNGSWKSIEFKRVLAVSFLGGVLGGILLITFYRLSLPYLPKEFLENAQSFTPPLYTKLLYGGITEEVIMRWGLMSFIVWGSYRLTQNVKSGVGSYNYILGIVLSALIFGIGHLPAAGLLSPVVTMPLALYVVIGNSLFGLIAGYLYWKKGLESAVLAHMSAHVVMIVGEKIA